MKDTDKGKGHRGNRGFDPVLAAWTNSRSMSNIFLKKGESLTFIQRAGVLVISLMIVCWGMYFGSDCLEGFRAGSPRAFGSAALSLFLLVFGMLGLRNGLKFKRRRMVD